MPDPGFGIAWALVALGVGAVAVRRGRSPVDAPLAPAACVAALIAGVGAFAGLSRPLQLAIAVGITASLLILGWRWRTLMAEDRLDAGAGGGRLVGSEGRVTVAIEPGHARGRVHVLGDEWPAAGIGDRPLEVGTTVVVRHVEGIRLHVATAETQPDRRSDRTAGPSDQPEPTDHGGH